VTKLKKYYGLGNDKNKIASFSSKNAIDQVMTSQLMSKYGKKLGKIG